MRRAQRIRDQLPSCYYEGFLEKRSLKNRTSRKLWAALCGDALFFFNNSKDCDYVEKQELSNFISLTDNHSLDASLRLRLQDDDIYLMAPSLEACELWKGFILSVVKLQVPTSLNLLPGQVHMLRNAVEKENERLKEIAEKAAAEQASKAAASPDSDDYMSLLPEMPACFCKLARIETENLLEKHKDKGNLLLRPSRDGSCFAVTTRQEYNGPVFQHYRVTRIPEEGFAIAVDNPIPCKTLHDVINYLIETTEGTFKPLVMEHTYDENIVYVDYDEENGEKRIRCASINPVRPNLDPKPAPKPAPKTAPKPALNPSPKPAPKTAPKPAPKTAPKPALNPSPKPTPRSSPKPALNPSPTPALNPSPKPALNPSPKPAPKPALNPSPKPALNPSPKPAPKSSPKPAPKSSPKPAPKSSPKPAPKSSPKPALNPSPKPALNPSPKPAPKPATEWKREQYESIYQNSFEEDDDLIDEDKCAPPPFLPQAPARPPKPQWSVPDLLIGPGGALLPPNSRPGSPSVVAGTKPRHPIPAVPIGETLSQSLNKDLRQKMIEMRVAAE